MKYLIIPALLLISSCRPSLQKCNELYGECGRIDTLARTVEYHDTTLVTRADTVVSFLPVTTRDTVRVNRLIEKFRKQHVYGENVRFFWVNDSTLKVESICPRETLTIKGKDKIEVRTQIKRVPVEVEHTPKWAWVVMGVLGGLLVLLFLIRG